MEEGQISVVRAQYLMVTTLMVIVVVGAAARVLVVAKLLTVTRGS